MKIENIFKVLSCEIRLRIIELLSSGSKNVSDIVKMFNLTQPTVSHHLRVLEKEGIVKRERHKKWALYSLKNEIIEKLKTYLDTINKGVKDEKGR